MAEQEVSGETFGQMLKRIRTERHMTQRNLSRCSFVSPEHITHLECEWDVAPKRETVCSIAAGLCLDGTDTARLLIAAGFWPWRMPDWAVTAFVEAVEDASAMGHEEEPTSIRSRAG